MKNADNNDRKHDNMINKNFLHVITYKVKICFSSVFFGLAQTNILRIKIGILLHNWGYWEGDLLREQFTSYYTEKS